MFINEIKLDLNKVGLFHSSNENHHLPQNTQPQLLNGKIWLSLYTEIGKNRGLKILINLALSVFHCQWNWSGEKKVFAHTSEGTYVPLKATWLRKVLSFISYDVLSMQDQGQTDEPEKNMICMKI